MNQFTSVVAYVLYIELKKHYGYTQGDAKNNASPKRCHYTRLPERQMLTALQKSFHLVI